MARKKNDDIEDTDDNYDTQEGKTTGKPNVSTTAEGEDDVKDVSQSELPDAEGTPPNQMTEEVQPEKVVTIQEQGIGPKDPYPTGNPPVYTEGDVDPDKRRGPTYERNSNWNADNPRATNPDANTRR